MPQQSVFKVCAIPDGGEFADGNGAALAWDVLHLAGQHRVPDVIDLSECVHLKPYAVACLCGLAELARAKGRTIIAMPPNRSECAQHLARMGMPAFFSGDWTNDTPRHTNIAIQRVTWPPGSQGERILEVLAPRAGLSPRVFPNMVGGLDEVVLNALTHADSPIDCIVAGQAFPNAGKVEVAVLDLGRTVKGHLTANPKYSQIQTDADAIQKAMEEGVTGTPDGQRNSRGELNSGAGLPFLRDYCEAGGGELTVLSGGAWVTAAAGRHQIIGTLRGGFQGCLVNIRYFCSDTLPAGEIKPIL